MPTPGGRGTIKDFRDLRVYQMAFAAAMSIFHLSKAWPKEERYSLTSQIRDASRSVAANIGEAWRKRRYELSFVSKLSDSDTEAGETLVWLAFAQACGYLAESDQLDLSAKYDHICAQLATMMSQSRRWCGLEGGE
jgi:four helix bundle protein